MSEFQHYGVHAIVRPDGDLFVNSTAVTLGEAEGREFLGFLMTEYGERDALMAVAEADQAHADEFNNEDYNDGAAPVVEPSFIVGSDAVVSTPSDSSPKNKA